MVQPEGFWNISNHAKLITVIASEAIPAIAIASFRFATFAMTLCNELCVTTYGVILIVEDVIGFPWDHTYYKNTKICSILGFIPNKIEWKIALSITISTRIC
ncbi:MAG: hypothetical protein RMX68_004375 [Aulosira sp. ZfuVER01]|nr:hypothetical protein [Aulosira sp. DedVER01a]MDZ8051473.1 hypothetical protein [Aulosira sp. ZfuCHP01]